MSVTMWSVTYQGRPVFYLDPNVQGIIHKAQAVKIACRVLGIGTHGAVESGLSVEKVDIDVPAVKFPAADG
jgi:hypothetical protein